MKRSYVGFGLAIVACGALGIWSAHWFAQPIKERVPAADGPVPDKPELQPQLTLEQIAQRLGDEATRSAALAQLKQVPYLRLERLRRLEREVTDPRVQADLEARVVELQEQMAANPPPISVKLKDASLEEVVGTFNEQMGTAIYYWSSSTLPHEPFTLQADQQPFWNIFFAANEQHPISFFSFREPLSMQEDSRGMPHHAIDGPFCATAQVYDNRPLPDRPAPPTTRPLKWTLRYVFGVDPRLWVIQADLRLTIGPDDAGNVLFASDAPFIHHPEVLYGNTFYAEDDITPPAGAGKYIPSLKIEGKVLLATSDLQTVQKFDAAEGRTFTLGDITFTAQCFPRPQIPRTDFAISAKTADGKTVPESSRARMRLLDMAEPRVSQPPLPPARLPGQQYQFNFPAIPPPPFALEVRIPRKTVERTVSFEIRNLPLPPL